MLVIYFKCLNPIKFLVEADITVNKLVLADKFWEQVS